MTLLLLLCFSLVSTISVDSYSQSMEGTYESVDKSATMEIEAIPETKTLIAKIKGFKISNGAIQKEITLIGDYRAVKQQGESLFLVTLQGMGSWKDSNGNKFPIALTLSGFITKINPQSMTTQYAAAFEFFGNAEDISGGIMGWKKIK